MASQRPPRDPRLQGAHAHTVDAADAARAAAAKARHALRQAADITIDMLGALRTATRAVGYNDAMPAEDALAALPKLADALPVAMLAVRAALAANEERERVYLAECRIRFGIAQDTTPLLQADKFDASGERKH